MPDFLLELLTEEIPARMQARAIEQLRDRFTAGLAAAGLAVGPIAASVTPRRLVLHAAGLDAASTPVSEERRGPRADAPEQAVAGFVKSTGLARDAMEERDTPKGRFLYATIVTPGRSAEAIIAELIPAIVRDFDWPKSMRWGDASTSTASLRWVRPLSGIVALLGDAVVTFAAAGVTSGRTTFGHRFMSSGPIEIGGAASYVDQLRAAHVMLDASERRDLIIRGADAAARAEGLGIIPDDGLVAENAGLTEWPVPLIGRFDPAFLDVPREVIQLTMRTNQKYFACTDASGNLAPAFVCVANIAADDGGAAIVAGNQKVLAARLSDAKFFWDADIARVRDSGLASFTPKLADIVFHEKLGTVADKVDRVAKLARWLVESGAVLPSPSPLKGEGRSRPSRDQGEGKDGISHSPATHPHPGAQGRAVPLPQGEREEALADLAETAARLCKADLVSATVGEFPEVQGIAGGHLALAEGLDPQIAAAIRDHYKPVGPSDTVPKAPGTVAVALADKLDTLIVFFAAGERPSGSRDPFALRRAALSIINLLLTNNIRIGLTEVIATSIIELLRQAVKAQVAALDNSETTAADIQQAMSTYLAATENLAGKALDVTSIQLQSNFRFSSFMRRLSSLEANDRDDRADVVIFLADRLKVQQREAGVRPDIIDAVFALGGEDDLVRLLARVKALQAVLQTPDGRSLLAGYRRGVNMLRIEELKDGPIDPEVDAELLVEPAEIALNAALDVIVPIVAADVSEERFESAMTALARLRPEVDSFFDSVTVNSGEQEVRRNRLALLARLRTAVHSVADFSKITD
ncbi:glycine--tRNA ligase subunit beta [Polymorphobacter sp. PAMC 29334]|uniref:glycine--tRNA ligase subunit beta n=1 Tax=Polymorphobacter sp. PAMC 29334 TaxID=2862331 RepID=UPI001C76B1B7|nr:glycine--tRNA ligase subunit beta [Polymorphobacter sp. PAMC 29334]QYE36013.1 glycine--tRNA ligase subunit beta [Polymorphobacter sp. PAMC 29334]